MEWYLSPTCQHQQKIVLHAFSDQPFCVNRSITSRMCKNCAEFWNMPWKTFRRPNLFTQSSAMIGNYKPFEKMLEAGDKFGSLNVLPKRFLNPFPAICSLARGKQHRFSFIRRDYSICMAYKIMFNFYVSYKYQII